MKKKVYLVVLFLLLFVAVANAGQYDWVKGASIGYVSSFSSPSVVFAATPGQSLVLVADPVASTVAYCGVSSFSSKSSIVTGFSTQYFFVTAPTDDLYMFLCIKYSGVSDDLVLIAADNSLLQIKSAVRVAEDAPQELKDRLQQEFMKVLGD